MTFVHFERKTSHLHREKKNMICLHIFIFDINNVMTVINSRKRELK